jgi:hypothetical protein
LLASAGIDRLCHRAEIVIIRGHSFRAQQRHLAEPAPAPAGPQPPDGGPHG